MVLMPFPSKVTHTLGQPIVHANRLGQCVHSLTNHWFVHPDIAPQVSQNQDFVEYLLDAWENQDFLGNPLRVAWQRRKAGKAPEWP